MNINCIIVDDEPRAHEVLKNYMSRLPHLYLSGSFFNAVEACTFMRGHHTDLILLDIEMPEINGFAMLEMLHPKPLVIVTTAYSAYAIKGYDYNVVDYLQKPIRFERFANAIEKAIKWKQLDNSPGPADNYMEIRSNRKNQRIDIKNIVFAESLGNYVKIHCTDGILLTLLSTSELEEKLMRYSFVRIHKSYIVNTAFIQHVGEGEITIQEKVLPIGKTYKKYVRETLQK